MKSKAVSVEKTHAKFSASASDRWMKCPGSIKLTEKAPPGRDSSYAKEGTDAHAALETLIKNRKARGKTVVFLRTKYSSAMIIHAEMALDVVEKRLAQSPGAELFIEVRADLPVSEPGQYGTADIVIADHFGVLEVIDYKYGAGIPISPVKNSQLIYYALGVAHRFDYNFSAVRLTVIQPRAQVDGEFVRSWDMSMEDLLLWREGFEMAIHRAKQPNAPLIAGSGEKNHCRFCPAAVICPEISQKAMEQARIEFAPESGELELPKVTKLSVEYLPEILAAADRIEFWLKSVKEYAFQVLKRGEKIPGFKLVGKRSTRKWTNIERAETLARMQFGDDAYEPVMFKSPAQLEKLGPKAKKLVTKLTSSISSGVTMVADDDRRPAVNPASDDFKDEVSEACEATE